MIFTMLSSWKGLFYLCQSNPPVDMTVQQQGWIKELLSKFVIRVGGHAQLAGLTFNIERYRDKLLRTV